VLIRHRFGFIAIHEVVKMYAAMALEDLSTIMFTDHDRSNKTPSLDNSNAHMFST